MTRKFKKSDRVTHVTNDNVVFVVCEYNGYDEVICYRAVATGSNYINVPECELTLVEDLPSPYESQSSMRKCFDMPIKRDKSGGLSYFGLGAKATTKDIVDALNRNDDGFSYAIEKGGDAIVAKGSLVEVTYDMSLDGDGDEDEDND